MSYPGVQCPQWESLTWLSYHSSLFKTFIQHKILGKSKQGKGYGKSLPWLLFGTVIISRKFIVAWRSSNALQIETMHEGRIHRAQQWRKAVRRSRTVTGPVMAVEKSLSQVQTKLKAMERLSDSCGLQIWLSECRWSVPVELESSILLYPLPPFAFYSPSYSILYIPFLVSWQRVREMSRFCINFYPSTSFLQSRCARVYRKQNFRFMETHQSPVKLR